MTVGGIFFFFFSGSAYLTCQVQSRGLREGAVDPPQHLAQLSHHGPEIVQEGPNGFIKNPTHCLEGGEGEHCEQE